MDKDENEEREEYYSKLKKQLGITLIALVITIIILLIIAGISIAQLTGSGIFEKALEAKERYKNAQELEDSILSSYDIEKISSTRDNKDTNPVGTVISCIRTTAPTGYLICNGTEYNISEYPELAEELRKVYNGYNTENAGKFKVPDLRGEFLRGTGTNSHTNQGNGGEVGEHQNAGLPNLYGTLASALHINSSNSWLFSDGGLFKENSQTATHSITSYSGSITRSDGVIFDASQYNSIYGNSTSVTPTNTSVLYCIKY